MGHEYTMIKTSKVTIKEVAKDAGVSVGTVSRVLAKTAEVKQPLRERVNRSIIKLKYKPNLAARALRANHVNVIGLMVPDITNPYFAQVANLLESEASKKGYALILASSHGDVNHEARQFSALLDHSPKGIVLIPTSDTIKMELPKNIRISILDRPLAEMNAIALDQGKSSALAADHLVELGHRKIAYIAGPHDIQTSIEREAGFSNRIAELQSKNDSIELTIFRGQFDYTSGEAIARDILSLVQSKRPTAIAAASDQQAIGAIRAATDMGVSVPNEVSVIGFDDIVLAELLVPRLTTIRQPVYDMVIEALDQILGRDDSICNQRYMGELIVRSTTAAV
jgi:LacI family transcriptional regulator|tara:strand:- start:118 stop:1134 length:1017 start_codon:yes stop_codon:yes gene_type:complete